MADPVLTPGNPPSDAQLPQSPAQLLNFVAAYLRLDGLSGLQGIIISDTEPAVSDRDKGWIKLDSGSGRAIGLFRYNGGWKAIPIILDSGENEPANAKPGELFYNTKAKAVKGFLDGGWTTELWHKGATADRPSAPPLGYLYFDTTINRLLRFVTNGWTTVDGCIGEVRILDGMSTTEALGRNPGWSVFNTMAGRFPIGQDGDDFPAGDEGGRREFAWSAKSLSAQGGARDQGALTEISIDGTALSAATGTTVGTKTGEVSILPPYRAVIFIKKDF